ncbi:DUF421 domain-containing protein [Alkalihalobacillus hwajinpoensis]|uniref:DUF421 domain-containing protein n=1 Tax=Guptibacillus hwajinpoensis TaxID=208199 RepID=UPI001883D8A9|nr:DUF421 domain-containing protein [Pseudalkalibacillus hwajinpoensis]MBF0708240.1 DUF421 domain-containing protein [Pseudalkalibacillus hwajinpoensis]
MGIGSITLELLVGFLALLVLTKALGKTQITQITPFDFISSLVLGELVGNAIYDKEVNILSIIYAVLLWGVLIYIVEWITQKFRATRSILEGNPSIVISHGKINRRQLQKNKLDINQLQNLLRQKDVFSLREVEFAILETNGSISVLKKSDYQQPTKQDFDLKPKQGYLSVDIISDGKIDWGNLHDAGFNEEWLNKILKEHNIDHAEDLLILEWQQDTGVFLQKIDKD